MTQQLLNLKLKVNRAINPQCTVETGFALDTNDVTRIEANGNTLKFKTKVNAAKKTKQLARCSFVQ